jgi:hypothetical protein
MFFTEIKKTRALHERLNKWEIKDRLRQKQPKLKFKIKLIERKLTGECCKILDKNSLYLIKN